MPPAWFTTRMPASVQAFNAGIGAGFDVDRVVADAAGGNHEGIRHARDQGRIDVKVPRNFVSRRADLIDMGRGKDWRGHVVLAFVFKPVEPHVAAAPENFRINRIRKILHIEDTLCIHGHGLGPFCRCEGDGFAICDACSI